jgi:hypothetical protein
VRPIINAELQIQSSTVPRRQRDIGLAETSNDSLFFEDYIESSIDAGVNELVNVIVSNC